MIKALAAHEWDRRPTGPVSRQKKDALFELACRVALISESARETGAKAFIAAARAEKRKTLRYGLDLLSEGADWERVDRSYALEPLFGELDAGSRLEIALIKSGLGSVCRLEHPNIVLRRMTAHLGAEYFDKASAWIASRRKRKRRKPLTLLVPGELPDLVRTLALDPASLERALRGAGRELSVAAMAGCAQESVDLAKGFFGPIGSGTFEDDAEFVRNRLSGDEIAQAQAAFIELVRGLEQGGELDLGTEDDFYNDPAYVNELTRAVMSLDDKSLKATFAAKDKKSLALAMQGMEPSAHDRILGLLAKRETKRLLDAIDDAAILPRREVLEAGRALAKTVIAAAEKIKGAPRDAIERFARIRDWASVGTGGAAPTGGAAAAETGVPATSVAASAPGSDRKPTGKS